MFTKGQKPVGYFYKTTELADALPGTEVMVADLCIKCDCGAWHRSAPLNDIAERDFTVWPVPVLRYGQERRNMRREDEA